jgi:hypothetical protein
LKGFFPASLETMVIKEISDEIKLENAEMWNSCFTAWKEVDNGRTSIQSWKKNSVRNRPFWLSKVQEALPRSTEQEDYFDIARWGHIALRQKGVWAC